MSEPIWVTMTVKVPASWNRVTEELGLDFDHSTDPPLFIVHASNALINGESPAIVETGDGWVDWQFTGEGNYGLLDSWLVPVIDFMEEHHIPYMAVEDSKYELQGEYRVFDGTEVRSVPYAADGCVMSEATWLGILAQHTVMDGAHINGDAVIEAVRAHFFTPDFSKVSVAHLPAECPQLTTKEAS